MSYLGCSLLHSRYSLLHSLPTNVSGEERCVTTLITAVLTDYLGWTSP